LAVFVTKADGRKELFDRGKVVRTCLRMGAARQVAETVAKKIETSLYDGIETQKILQMIFRQLSRHEPVVKHKIDLRKALSLMKSKPDFEFFIRALLSEHGYEVTPNQIVNGKCVEHEVDAIARKDGLTYIVEVKHHSNYHVLTGLDVSRVARAVFEDVTEGFELRLNSLKIDKAMIVCNTKFSEHAERYAECRGIKNIGWNSPPDLNIQTMITEKKLYPITYLKGLTITTTERLTQAGIILLKQLTAKDPRELRRETRLPKEALDVIIKRARMIV